MEAPGRDIAFHDDYLAAWNRATASGNADELRPYIADDYHGWAGTDARNVDPFSTADAWEGFTQAVAALRGTSVRAENRTVGRRGDRRRPRAGSDSRSDRGLRRTGKFPRRSAVIG